MSNFKSKLIIIAPLIWLVAIWAVSSIPGKKMPSVRIVSADKLAHVAQYLVLALLTNRSVRELKIKDSAVPWIYLALLLSAGLDELHQHLIPFRSVTFWDFVANGVGLGIGFGLFWRKRDRS